MLLPSDCTMANIESLHEELCALLPIDSLTLDASDVNRVDDAFIQLMIAANKEIDNLIIENLSDNKVGIFTIYDLEHLIKTETAE